MCRAALWVVLVAATGCGEAVRGKAIDLAGPWVLDGEGTVGEAVAFCGPACIIQQDGNALSVLLQARTVTYAVDGSESHRAIRMTGTETEVVTTAAWGAGKLVITERARSRTGDTPDAQRMFEIVRRGDQMIVDVTTLASGVQPRTSQATYSRQP